MERKKGGKRKMPRKTFSEQAQIFEKQRNLMDAYERRETIKKSLEDLEEAHISLKVNGIILPRDKVKEIVREQLEDSLTKTEEFIDSLESEDD